MIKGYQFIDPSKEPARRLILAVDAIEKEGKTRFLLTAPGPIGYMDWDQRSEGTIEQFLKSGKPIAWRTKDDGTPWPYQIPKDTGASDAEGSQVKTAALAEWKRFEDDFENLIGTARTIGVDTASELWECLRLGGFGKLNKIPPHLYDEVNAAYRRLIRLVRQQSFTSLILVHKLKNEYKNDDSGKGFATGRKKRSGFGETGFLVDCNIKLYRLPPTECDKDDLGFRLEVIDCGANAELRGLVLANEMISFPQLAVMIYPDTTHADWM